MNLLLLALVPACFALNPVIGRALADQFGPATLSVVRWALSALLVALLVVWRRDAERWRATAGLLTHLGVLGILGMGFCAFAAYEAARTTEATNIGLIRLHQRVRCRLGDRRRPPARHADAGPRGCSLPVRRGAHPDARSSGRVAGLDLLGRRPMGNRRHAGIRDLNRSPATRAGVAHAARAVHGDEHRRHAGVRAAGWRRDLGRRRAAAA